ncbi:MAG: TonB-dependent receptor plug domain-containing protein [Desulfovibrionaceae bacterium]
MEDVIYLDTYTVTDTAEEDSLNKSSLRVEEKNRSNNIADYLANDPEISFKRKSNIGDSGDVISIRGFESKRIMLNLDGRSISSTGNVGGNYIDFSTIPLDNIERIEIVKGGSSIEYGNHALGGVINAYTKAPEEEPSIDVYATVGGWKHIHDFHNYRAGYAQKFGNVGLSLGASHQEAEAYLRNNDYMSVHVYPKLTYEAPWNGKLSMGWNYSYTDRGLIRSNRNDGDPDSDSSPGLAGWDDSIDDAYPTASGEYFAGGTPTPSMSIIGEGAHWVKRRHLFDVTYQQDILEDGFLNVMLFKNHESRNERNYADVAARVQAGTVGAWAFNAALTQDGDLVMERNVTVDKSYGAKVKGGWELEDHSLLAGWEYKVLESGGIEVRYVDTNYNKHPSNVAGEMESSQGSPMAYVTGIFAGDRFQVTDSLLVDFGARLDRFQYTPDGAEDELNNHQISPKVTATYAFDDHQTITAAAYKNYRTPTLPELYWASQAKTTLTWLDGVDIKPESELGFDLAYRYRFDGGASVQLSGYWYDIEDYIMHKSVSTGGGSTWAAFNTDAEIRGLTLTANYPVLETVMLQLSGTWQKTKKDNDPSDPENVLERLDYIPDVKALAGISWDITPDLVLDTTANYVGQRDYTISSNSLDKGTLGAYTTVGASLRYKLDERTTLELYGDNLTNTRYEESWGYPSMGTNIGVGFKWNL